MTHETVELPFDEAVTLEAKQNLERDQRVLGKGEAPENDDDKVYRDEAVHLMSTHGEGYIPEFPDHKLVKVKK